MNSIETLLSRLDGVRKTKVDTWLARCPSHGDRSPSLSIRACDDGRILIHCFAGCSVHEVIGAAGMSITDLFPPKPPGTHFAKPERRPFPASDVLRAVGFEGLVIVHAGLALLNGQAFAEGDRERMSLAIARIQSALDVAGVRHG
jgi:hypothetical protein